MSIIGYSYAAVLLLGGVIGYLKGKSTVSLGAGIGAAIVAALAAFVSPHHPRMGDGILGLLAVAMIAVFASRFQKTKKAMPAIPMLVISALVLVAAGLEVVMK
jgi:uncharacterized membrane protein (UPF0136 family)